MINNGERTCIYMCLDTLRDTRLATLGLMNDDYAFAALLNEFPIRWTDDPVAYGNVCDTAEYFKQYAARNSETLKLSYPTEFALDFNNIISDLECRSIANDPTVGRKLEIIVNYWPYNLKNSEVTAFLKTLRVLFKCVTPIKMINRPLKDVTTNWLKEMNVVAAYIYDGAHWVDEAITRRAMSGEGVGMASDIVVYLPSLMRDAEQAKVLDECMAETGYVPDVFKAHQFSLKDIIAVEWVNSIYYSISPTILFPNIEPDAPPEPEKEDDRSPPPVDRAFLNGGP